MRINFLYIVCISLLFFGCKHDTSKCPECPKAHAEDVLATTTTAKFLTLSDVHVDSLLQQTQFQDHNQSDKSVSSQKLWLRAKTKIEATVTAEKPKFMVYLGDLPGYDHYNEDEEQNIKHRRTNTHLMLENLRNLKIDIPILYLPGNNDSLEGDYHSFSTDSITANTVLTNDADTTNPWPIINSKSSSITVGVPDFNSEFGFYSVDLTEKGNTLKVIALNTVIFTHSHYTDDDKVSQQAATNIQMAWLEKKMLTLGKNDRVLLVMHIPIGDDGYSGKPMWNQALTYKGKGLHNSFLDLIEKYQPNIVGLLNGHTHLDGLRRIYKTKTSTNPKASDMTSFSITTPGIAVNHGNNPAFKTFTYHTTNFDLLDFKTHYATPTMHVAHPNNHGYNNTDFKFVDGSTYTFKDAYKITDPNETIFTSLMGQSDPQIIRHMNCTLGANSNRDVKLSQDGLKSINVFKN
ncbi:calcineurin-like phosphoesterase [Kordia sp. SMS9]|uniref:metallophosphoesterase n=1 Tax=Kordia sp. SMS9 TaxID=2282170 RepID=UPI000E0D4060|nr:metallophosphoesterase [Kordia sp. SMS9]AXG70561.1 calcineurin-like phosphoesterase [Kordia sp. SMS9]